MPAIKPMNFVVQSVPAGATFPPDEACKFLGVTEKTLANWRNRGRGPAYVKYGRMVAYQIEDLLAFIEQCRVNTGGAK